MRINLRTAKSGKMFAATDDPARLQAVEIRACEPRDLRRLRAEGARAQTVRFVVAAKIEYRRKVEVEAEQP